MSNQVHLYWSRCPGKFVNKMTGQDILISSLTPGPMWSGSVMEWYETLVETIIDAVNIAGFSKAYVHASPETLTILQCSVAYRAVVDPMTYVPNEIPQYDLVGTLNNRFKVVLDENQTVDEILISEGGSWKMRAIVQVLDLNV